MKRIRIAILFAAGLFVSRSVHANDPMTFHHVKEALSQNTITQILQDESGFMWFGTRHGFNKFDGQKFKAYLNDPLDSTSISDSRINDALIDGEGNFWVATDKGVNRFDRSSGIFTRYLHDPKNPNSLGSNFTTAIYEDHQGYLWIGTEDAGLTRFDRHTGEYIKFRNNTADPFTISSNNVTSILEDYNGNLWVGTWGGGLNLLDRNTNRFVIYDTQSSFLKSDIISVIHRSEQGIWVGTTEGLYLLSYRSDGQYLFEPAFAEASKEFSQILESATILSLLEEPSGKVWIGTENRGLFVWDPSTKILSHYLNDPANKTSLSSNSIWSLYKDRSGIIWIGTFNQGLDKIDPRHRSFNHHWNDPLSNNTITYDIVSSFEEQEGKGLWVGTDGGGLNFIDYTSGHVTSIVHDPADPSSLAGNAVLSLLFDSNDNLWIASWEGGVSVQRPGQSRFERIVHNPESPNSLPGSDAFYLMEDHKSNIWVSVFRSGIAVYDRNLNKVGAFSHTAPRQQAISSSKVRAIIETTIGELWIGTEGNGLDHIVVNGDYEIISKENFVFDPNDDNSLSHNTITHLHEDTSGKIWVSTFGGGINILDTEFRVFERMSTADGLPSNVVLSIEEDLNGNIWAGTSNGLCMIDRDLNVQVYDVYDGLQNPEFTKSASFLANDGQLYFGGTNGYNNFNPADIIKNEIIPSVLLTGITISGDNELSCEDESQIHARYPDRIIHLGHDENDITFEFAVLNYSQSEKNSYAYQLMNYDDWWIESRSGFVSYSNVAPGTYTFRVKGANNDGIWNEEGDSIKIIIEEPWYSSRLAYSMYAMLIAMGLVFARQGIINRERLKNELKLEHLELTKMQEVNELKSRFFANISHEFRTPLTLILGPLKSLINETYKGDPKSQYRVMARNADRLLRLINQILDLSKLESGSMQLQASREDIVKFLKPIAYSFTSYAERQFVDYKCSFPEKEIEIYFERDKIEKVVVNLLSNAFKYTPEFGKVRFDVTEEDDSVTLTIQDTGVGIAEEHLKNVFDRFYQVDNQQQKGTGIGLALTKELVDLHRGEIKLASELGTGTTFHVKLFKGESHLNPDDMIGTGSKPEEVLEKNTYHELELSSPSPGIETIQDSNETNLDDLPIILIAEDNDDMRSFISEYLVTNYQILEAPNGEKALEIAHEKIPDVIISDIMMPVMNGYELCHKIKTDDRTSHIPVILLTAKASGESAEKGFELGADYYVTKPFNPKLLELRIKNILKTRDHIRNQLLHDGGPSIEPKELQIPSKDQEFLKRTIKCVEDNMDNSEFGVDDLCRELGLSRTQLYRKLKGLVGQSANEFVRSFRLKRAAQLLKKQEMTISEVTYQVGFNDLQYFRYCFKKQFGVNPSEYAQSLQ